MSISAKSCAEEGFLLLSEVTDLLAIIDSVPSSVVASLPAMPGFDRDYVNVLVDDSIQYFAASLELRGFLASSLSSLQTPDIDGRIPDPLEVQLKSVVGWCKDWINAIPPIVVADIGYSRARVGDTILGIGF